MKIFLFFLILIISSKVYSKELKPLSELLELNSNHKHENSLIMMQRCAALYGALHYISSKELNDQDYENRYKIFLQSSIIKEIEINGTSEEDAYYNQINEFKYSLTFFIQILTQNMKKNNSYFRNHWIEKDLEICSKF